MLAKLLTAPMGAKNADFQTADFTGILVSNNAPRERDLGKKEALGQGATIPILTPALRLDKTNHAFMRQCEIVFLLQACRNRVSATITAASKTHIQACRQNGERISCLDFS